MTTSALYTEMLQRVGKSPQFEAPRPYPISCFDVFLLSRAQERAKHHEAGQFTQLTVRFDWDLRQRQRTMYLEQLQDGYTLVLTDLSNTILWTSQSFLAMTGYSPAEVLGRSPGLLQGPATDWAAVRQLSEALNRAEPVSADLLNYRKGGEPYYCRVTIEPLFNRHREMTHFLAIEHELT